MSVAVEHLPVSVSVNSAILEGTLSIPSAARGVVLFAHGSGSSRLSPRNRYVADILNEGGLATLLIDFLTADEQQVDLQTSQLRFDIPFLAHRLVAMLEWSARNPQIAGLPIGLFGASTGAAAALVAAAQRPKVVRTVVSRGGRPDLAGEALPQVVCPVLLIVGGADAMVLDLNQEALLQMHCEHAFKVIPGATHLFGEPGALDRVAALARDWFLEKLPLRQ